MGNGSAFLLRPSNETFLVTVNHVYEDYCATLKKYPDTVCILREMRLDLKERYKAHDKSYDVATFCINQKEINELKERFNKVPLIGSQNIWPPKPPEIGKGVFFLGFPGDGRKMLPYKGNSVVETDWTGYTGLATASGVSHTDVNVLLEHDPDYDVGLRPEIPKSWALGGCSGAPLLTLVEHERIYSWRLAGIIYEAPKKTVDSPAFLQLMKAARADCLNSDGSINVFPDFNKFRY